MSSGDEENYVKKSTDDPRILELILNQPATANWKEGNYKPYNLVKLTSDSLEYAQVKAEFEMTNRGLVITNIARVENPFLLGQYLLKKEKMKRENPYVVSERTFFHGTRKCNIAGICKNNFDWRRRGQASRGHKFGQGVSFTPQVSYARHYTFHENVFFMVNVLVGRSTIGNSLTKIPPEPYDTTENLKGSVYVKYEDDDFYPEYVITCSPTYSL